MSRSRALTSLPPSSHVAWTVVGGTPRPDADARRRRAQCDSAFADLRSGSVERRTGLDPGKVPGIEDDRLVGGTCDVDEGHLVERLAEVDHGVALGVHPPQTSAPERHRALTSLDEAAIDGERASVPSVLVPRHRTSAVLTEGALHTDLVAVGHHR